MLAERILNAEVYHLGQEPEETAGDDRNGSGPKTVLTDAAKRSTERMHPA